MGLIMIIILSVMVLSIIGFIIGSRLSSGIFICNHFDCSRSLAKTLDNESEYESQA